MKGKFIVLEGPDGSGKTTQIAPSFLSKLCFVLLAADCQRRDGVLVLMNLDLNGVRLMLPVVCQSRSAGLFRINANAPTPNVYLGKALVTDLHSFRLCV